VRETLVADLQKMQREQGLTPDFVFFTGDAAFGHLGMEKGKSIADQFQEAADFLDAVRRAFVPEIPLRNLFLVPGNHDVDRRQVAKATTQWLDSQKDLDPVLQLIQDAGSFDWRMAMARLGAYMDLLRQRGLDHLLGDPERAIYTAVREIRGLKVGIAGFNTAWSCGRDGERGRLWAAGRWQLGTLRQPLREADFSIALLHHPPDWLVEHESPDFGRALAHDFRFLLHGHEHKGWVQSGNDGFTTIAAGACYDRSDKDTNGYNFVRLDAATGGGEVWLRRYDATGGGWVPHPIHKQTDDRGVRPLALPWLAKLRATGENVAPASPSLHTAPPPSPKDQEVERYKLRLREACRFLPVLGSRMGTHVPIRLDEVYIPLRAAVHHRALEVEHRKVGAFRELAPELGEDRDVLFDEVIPLARGRDFRGVLVLGDPGSGKSTLLKHFVLAVTDPAASPERLGLPGDVVPVLIELRKLKDPTAGLRAALGEAVAQADISISDAAFAAKLIERDRLLVLIDGLDEIADAGQRSAVSRRLEDAVLQLPHSVFVVTSRYAGYKGESRLQGRFLELHIRDLREKEVRKFIRDWYGAIEEQDAPDREPEVRRRRAEEGAGALAGRIFNPDDLRTRSLRDLATNPLLLQILCLVHRSSNYLPESRAKLYQECAEVLLERWRRAKGLPVALTAAQALKLLQPLAYWLHTQERKEVQLAEIRPHLAEPLHELGKSPADAEPLLNAIRDQSGLLVSLEAGEQGAYAFLHLSFQEYLCARHIQDRVLREPDLLVRLAERREETWWREVLLLSLGLDTPSLFEPLMAELLRRGALRENPPKLIEDCLRDAACVTARPLLQALAGGLERNERYQALRLLRSLHGWETQTSTDDTAGRVLVERSLTDLDPQVAGMAAELLGVPASTLAVATRRGSKTRPAKPGEPAPGEERLHKDGTVLLYVPGGEYTLGADDIGDDERPVHLVELSPFWIAKYPVTNEQYARFLAANPGSELPELWADKGFNQPQQPVVGVSRKEAQAYCRWAGLRLPSEAQWEAAARGRDRRRYPWGNDKPTPKHANFANRENGTTPVGAYPKGAGPFGALDQAGNVWEWCEDVWNPEAYRDRNGQRDPVSTSLSTGLSTTGDSAVRCLRGGSWSDDAGYLAAAYRFRSWASNRFRYFGFRCLSSAVPEP
jgi:formylglycine-generating enzyme required for sulfatase activity